MKALELIHLQTAGFVHACQHFGHMCTVREINREDESGRELLVITFVAKT